MPSPNTINNTGKTTPITNPKGVADIKSGVDKQAALGQASATAQGTDNNAAASAQSGFKNQTPPPSATANNGTPVVVDMPRIFAPGAKQEFKKVGTTINTPNPINNRPPEITTEGTPSIFNDYWLVHYNSNLDTVRRKRAVTNMGEEKGYKGLAFAPEYKNPTTSKIVEVFNGKGTDESNYFSIPEKRYTYSDFLYLKHYHPYNNNRLITLRRFLVPVYDNCEASIKANDDSELKFKTPISKALTYLGVSENKLSTLANFTVSINTDMFQGNSGEKPTMVPAGEFANLKAFAGESKGNYDETSFGYALMAVMSGADDPDTLARWRTAMDPWSNGAYSELVLGPVNVIMGARIRKQGLSYTHAINVNFEYSTKYIERINPKAAMLDIISNMLTMTYHHANFFGGANRFQFNKTNFPFLGNDKAVEFIKKLKSGNETEVLKEYATALQGAGSNVLSSAKTLVDGLTSGNGINDNSVKDILTKAAEIATSMNKDLQNLNKSITEGTKGTLNGAPTGEWHLQVGNPFAPVMMIGNLWCTSATFTFNDDFSADDFPTELKVAIKLDFGRQRDSSDIESMFNTGGGRIYYPYKDKLDANISSTFYNTEYAFNNKPSNDSQAFNQTDLTFDTLGKTPLEPKVNEVKAGIEATQPINTNKK